MDFISIEINVASLELAKIIHVNYMMSNKSEIGSDQKICLNSPHAPGNH